MGLGEEVMESGRRRGRQGSKKAKEGVGALVTATGRRWLFVCHGSACPCLCLRLSTVLQPSKLPSLDCVARKPKKKKKKGSLVNHMYLLALLAEITTSPRSLQRICIIKH